MTAKLKQLLEAHEQIRKALVAQHYERTGGVGSESRDLLPETRSGVGDKATKSPGSDTPLPDQGTGEAWRLIEKWADEAATLDQAAKDEAYWEMGEKYRSLRHDAAVCREKSSELEAALRGEPRPQSEADGVEEPRCLKDGNDFRCKGGHLLRMICEACPRRGKRKERSVSGNAYSPETSQDNPKE